MRPVRLTMLIVFAATAAVGIYFLAASRNGVRVYSVNERLRIDDAHYSSGTNWVYSYFTPGQKLKLECERVLRTLHLRMGRKTWAHLPPIPVAEVYAQNPALVVCGEIEDGSSAYLDLLTDDGKPYGKQAMPTSLSLAPKPNTFLWHFTLVKPGDATVKLHLTNGLYHIRRSGDTNDLALVRVRL